MSEPSAKAAEPAVPPSTMAKETAPVPPTSPTPWQRWRAKLKPFQTAIVAVAGVGAVLSGLVGYYTTYKTVAGTTPATLPSAPTAVNPLSIMVLPFANQTGDDKKAYIADALTGSITGDLSRIQDALIVPTATAVSLQKKNLTIPQLGLEAGVRFVLMGSVTSSGEQMRISAQLSDAQSGAQLWAENFDGNQKDLFALQDQVTTKIGNSIGPQMVIVAARDSEKRKSTPKVADLLMRAKALKLRPASLQNLQATEALYRQALALDPDNPGITADLAYNLAVQANNYADDLKLDMAGTQAMAKQALDMARKAQDADPNNPTVYIPISIYAMLTGDMATALQSTKRLAELQPKALTSYVQYGGLLSRSGDPQASKAALLKGLELASPARQPAELYSNLAETAFMLDQADEAIAWAQKAVAARPDYYLARYTAAIAYALKGDAAQARREGAETLRLNPQMRINVKDDWPVWPGKDKEYHAFIDGRLLPAARMAGIPE